MEANYINSMVNIFQDNIVNPIKIKFLSLEEKISNLEKKNQYLEKQNLMLKLWLTIISIVLIIDIISKFRK